MTCITVRTLYGIGYTLLVAVLICYDSLLQVGVECIACEFVMKELEKLLGENSTEVGIVQ